MKNDLYLEDFNNLTAKEVRAKIAYDFGLTNELDRFEVLIAYMSEGSFGCDSSAWLLLRDRNTRELFEVHGSHCSCYGFEGQFSPEITTVEYLRSDKFSFSCGGFDSSPEANYKAVVDWIANRRFRKLSEKVPTND
jgi:hypothetical protein